MKPKIKVKIGIDIVMIMFFLFIMHHALNHRWIRNQRNARWSVLRIWQIILVIWVLITMFGSMISGVILSRTVFTFLPMRHGQGTARIIHLICAYWGLVGMSLHLGLHCDYGIVCMCWALYE